MMKRKERLNGRMKCISFLLAVVILLFSLPAGVWLAEDGGIIADGVYLLDNAYCSDNYTSYGKFYLRTDGVKQILIPRQLWQIPIFAER